MALYVNTNASSLNAQRMMANSTNSLDTSYKRLASGLRINSAKDDAAGLQISDRLTSQINGLNQGNRNAQDGISMAQTAEGAMDEMTTMYQRIRTLALQSANGTNSSADRTALQEEVTSLCSEIDRISAQTTFGGVKILDGTTTTTVDFQVGADANQKISMNLTNGADSGKSWSVKDVAGAVNVSTGLRDGAETGSKAFDITDADKAQLVIGNIDKFIAKVDSKRAELGATQNRLESTIRNQSNVSENVSARLRLRDCGHDPAEHYPAGLPVHSEPGQPETAGSAEPSGIIAARIY